MPGGCSTTDCRLITLYAGCSIIRSTGSPPGPADRTRGPMAIIPSQARIMLDIFRTLNLETNITTCRMLLTMTGRSWQASLSA